ncbi:MAG: 3-deoxy-7-phosphoheptulonate synthase [Chloroflexi bacterium]|nr:3-deoxy-7-phosphoheptulonate synthase [Chloroflexota bacterium]
MIIVMKAGASKAQIDTVVTQIRTLGCQAHLSQGTERTIIGVIGDERQLNPDSFQMMEGVEKTLRVLSRFKLASRDFHPEDTLVKFNGVTVGSKDIVVMAGPCAVESREQMHEVGWALKEIGIKVLRGGAYKPRTSPYSFQGLGRDGLEILAEVREETGLAVVTEVMDPKDVEMVSEHVDVLQVGARNMQNYALLHAVGELGRPVLLKRGMMSTIEELLMSAEYILSHDNNQVMICERGIRTFETYTRNTLDINAVPALKQLSHLPVIVDPSHGTGRWELVSPISKAALAAGADGLILEVHPHPAQALSDGAQSLKPETLDKLMRELKPLSQALGRDLL